MTEKPIKQENIDKLNYIGTFKTCREGSGFFLNLVKAEKNRIELDLSEKRPANLAYIQVSNLFIVQGCRDIEKYEYDEVFISLKLFGKLWKEWNATIETHADVKIIINKEVEKNGNNGKNNAMAERIPE